MLESESTFYFIGDSRDVYDRITDLQDVIDLWTQLAFLQEQSDVDYETVFEISDGFGTYKVVYGPAYTIVFQITLGGMVEVYAIHRSRMNRRGEG